MTNPRLNFRNIAKNPPSYQRCALGPLCWGHRISAHLKWAFSTATVQFAQFNNVKTNRYKQFNWSNNQLEVGSDARLCKHDKEKNVKWQALILRRTPLADHVGLLEWRVRLVIFHWLTSRPIPGADSGKTWGFSGFFHQNLTAVNAGGLKTPPKLKNYALLTLAKNCIRFSVIRRTSEN